MIAIYAVQKLGSRSGLPSVDLTPPPKEISLEVWTSEWPYLSARNVLLC